MANIGPIIVNDQATAAEPVTQSFDVTFTAHTNGTLAEARTRVTDANGVSATAVLPIVVHPNSGK